MLCQLGAVQERMKELNDWVCQEVIRVNDYIL